MLTVILSRTVEQLSSMRGARQMNRLSLVAS